MLLKKLRNSSQTPIDAMPEDQQDEPLDARITMKLNNKNQTPL